MLFADVSAVKAAVSFPLAGVLRRAEPLPEIARTNQYELSYRVLWKKEFARRFAVWYGRTRM